MQAFQNKYCSQRQFRFWLLIVWALGVDFYACEDKIVVKDDITPPVILEGPQVQVADTCAVILWETDEPCSVAVEYALVGAAQKIRVVSPEFRQYQAVLLSPLQPEADYTFTTYSYDAYGNNTVTEPLNFRTTIDTNAILLSGWQAYQAHQYLSALTYFQRYRQYRPAAEDGLLGLGWAQLRIDSLTISGVTTLNSLLLSRPDDLGALAGVILGYYLLGNWASVVVNGENFLGLAPADYSFQYDSKISTYGIRLLLAEAYHRLENFEAAQALLNVIYPANNLSPTDSTTWKIGDINFTYESYEDALGGWIAYLQWEYWEQGLPKQCVSNFDVPPSFTARPFAKRRAF